MVDNMSLQQARDCVNILLMNLNGEEGSLNLQSVATVESASPFRAAPNLLTLLRIFLVPFLMIAVIQRHFALAFGLFLMAAATDAMDGLLARLLRQRTRLGQYLDPIADKLMLSSLFLVFTSMGILEPYIAVIVFGRDIGMLLTAWILYNLTDVRDFHPTFLGKANSFSQVVAVGAVLLSLIPGEAWGVSGQNWIAEIRALALDMTILLTVASGFHYALVASRRIGAAVQEHTGASPAGVQTPDARPAVPGGSLSKHLRPGQKTPSATTKNPVRSGSVH